MREAERKGRLAKLEAAAAERRRVMRAAADEEEAAVQRAASLVEAQRRVEERLPAARNLNVSPLTVEEMRAMTRGMTAEQMNALADSRALL